MDYKSLKEWEDQILDETLPKVNKVIECEISLREIFKKGYLQWMFNIEPKKPCGYYQDIVITRHFPKLWSTLPFYKLHIVEIPSSFQNKGDFQQYFGMDVETFKVFCEYEKIQPMINAPSEYRNMHFLDSILREKPPCYLAADCIFTGLYTEFYKLLPDSVKQKLNRLFPKDSISQTVFLILSLAGYKRTCYEIKHLIKNKKINRDFAKRYLNTVWRFYNGPVYHGGDNTQILSEKNVKDIEEFGLELCGKKEVINNEIHENLLNWLGFRLPKKIDRKYVSKYIEICDNLSPDLQKIVLDIENKAGRYDNAKDELRVILDNLESELEKITERRNMIAGSLKWLSAIPITIIEDLLVQKGLIRTADHLDAAKESIEDFITNKAETSIKIGATISTLTGKEYLVRNVWKVKETIKKLPE